MSRANGTTGAKGNSRRRSPRSATTATLVVFTSAATNLAAADTNGVADVFLRSAVFGASPTTAHQPPAAGAESDGPSTNPSISRNPTNNTHLIAFKTAADNMGADDENDFTQVYGRLVRHRALARTPRPTSPARRRRPFRSGVNFSHLRSPERSGENLPR